jgi:hypothetical protein
MKKQKEKIKYSPYSFRLNYETYKKLKEIKIKSGMSWNRIIYTLTKLYEDNL